MTPKEKAKELVLKFKEFPQEGTLMFYVAFELSKQCALIAVDLVINQWEYIDSYLADANGELNPNLKYWYEVKQEIELL